MIEATEMKEAATEALGWIDADLPPKDWSFSGSYDPSDAIFLLEPMEIEELDIDEKERMIRQKTAHYSEMLLGEKSPSARSVELYEAAIEREGGRLAAAIASLAAAMAEELGSEATVVSIARAGTPIGAAIARTLRDRFGIEAPHYSISAIRDKGLDMAALRWIARAGRAAETWAFVDGWTGKGVISREIAASAREFSQATGSKAPEFLWVPSDLAGATPRAASREDWLIPSALLNATVSGLVSRSVHREEFAAGAFHGCKHLTRLSGEDRSQDFLERVARMALEAPIAPLASEENRAEAKKRSESFVASAMAELGLTDPNLFKPGLGESTRVMLRRHPEALWVRDPRSESSAHLLHLAQELGTPVEIRPEMPYAAAAAIRSKD